MILTPRMSCKIGRKPSSQEATILVLEMKPLLLRTCCLLLLSKWCSGELLQTLWKLPFTSNGLNANHVFIVSHPVPPFFWEICFMCGCWGLAHFAAFWFHFCQIVISEDRVTSYSRRVWRRLSVRSGIWHLYWLCSGFRLMLLVWCVEVLQVRSREDWLFRLSYLWRHLGCNFCHVPTGM